jgi:thioredoxin reductase
VAIEDRRTSQSHYRPGARAFIVRRDQDTASDPPQPLPLEASWPGVFAAGDVRCGSIKRVASAVGEGAMAVQLVHRHLARS